MTLALSARGSVADEPEAAAKPLTAAECDRLIEQLANPGKPPFTKSYVLDLPEGVRQSDLYRKQKPIAAAYGTLGENVEVALPALAAHFEDKRFSYVYEDGISGVFSCMTVGGACRQIVNRHVEVYREVVTKYDADGRSKSLWFIHDACGGIVKWWEDRRGRSLAELQLEGIEWAMRQPKPTHSSRSEWETARKSLERMAKQIGASGKSIQVNHKAQFFSK